MAETFALDDLAEAVGEQVAMLLETTARADPTSVERVVCLSLLRMPDDLAILVLHALEAHGADGAACLAATTRLARPAVAAAAAEALERLDPAARARVPEHIGALDVGDVAAVHATGAILYLLRLERPGTAGWQAATVVVEEAPDGPVLVAASITEPQDGGDLTELAAPALEHGGRIAAVEAAAAAEAIEQAARNSRARGIGVGVEAVACLPLVGGALGLPAEATCRLDAAGGPSPLALPPDDEATFLELREGLVAAFGEWLAGEHDGGIGDLGPFVAELMLDFKWGYGDGDLGRWTEEDLAELMLEHVPRKVDVDAELEAGFAPAAAEFLRFLDAAEMLSGAPVIELCLTSDALAEEFAAAAADRGHWGPAKLLAAELAADGIDLGDGRAVQDWIDGFNARPVAERDAILGPLPRMPGGLGAPTKGKQSSARAKSKRKSARAARRRNR